MDYKFWEKMKRPRRRKQKHSARDYHKSHLENALVSRSIKNSGVFLKVKRIIILFVIICLIGALIYSALAVKQIYTINVNKLPYDSTKVNEWREDDRLNVLVLGLDRNKNNPELGFVDYLSVVMFDPIENKIGILNVDVNMSVYVPSKQSTYSIRTLYNLALIDKQEPDIFLKEALTNLFTVNFDRYVVIDETGLKRIISTFGYISIKSDSIISDGDNNYTIKKGNMNIFEDEAYDYLAVDADSSASKLQRQNEFIQLLFKNVTSFKIYFNIFGFTKLFEDAMYTNLQQDDILRIYSLIRKSDIRYTTDILTPPNYNPDTVIEIQTIDQKIGKIFTYDRVKKEQARVEVFNGTNERSLGANTARILTNRGIDVIRYGNTGFEFEESVVYIKDQSKFKETYDAISDVLDTDFKIVSEEELPFVYTGDIIIIMGKDYNN